MYKKTLNIFWICGFILICVFINLKTALAVNCTITAVPDSGISPFTAKFYLTLDTENLTSSSILWDFDDGTTSMLPYPFLSSHTYTSAGTYTPSYRILSSDQGTCECSTTITVQADENEPPKVTLKARPDSGAAPLEVMFTPFVTEGTKPYSFSYLFGDGTSADGNEVGTDGSILHTYQKPGDYTARIKIRDSENLSTTSDTEIIVKAPDKMEVTIESNTDVGMVPFQIKLSAMVKNGTKPYHYVWVIDDQKTSSQTKNNYFRTFKEPGDHNIYLNVTDSTGNTAVSNTLNITAMLPLAIELETNSNKGFAPLQVSFFVNIIDGTPPFTINYDFGDGIVLTGTETIASHEYTEKGDFNAIVSVIDKNGSKTEKSILIKVIDSLDDKEIDSSLTSVTTDLGNAKNPETMQQLIKNGNTIMKDSMESLNNASDETKTRVKNIIQKQTETLMENTDTRLKNFEDNGTANTDNTRSIISELSSIISETAKNDIILTDKSISEIQSISEIALRLGLEQALSDSGLSDQEIERIRTDTGKANSYFTSHPDKLSDVLSISQLNINTLYEPDRSLVESTAKEKGIQNDDLYKVQAAIPKVIDVSKEIKKNNETTKDDSIIDLMIEMLNKQASGEMSESKSRLSSILCSTDTYSEYNGLKISTTRSTSSDDSPVDNSLVSDYSIDQLTGNIEINFKQTSMGMALNEFSIGSSYFPDGIYKMDDGSFIGINDNFNFRLYPAPADSVSVITQIINQFGITPTFYQTGRLTVDMGDTYLSMGMAWNITGNMPFTKTNPPMKSMQKFGSTAGGASFSGTGGTDTAAYAFSVLVEYENGSSQLMPPMIMAEEELLPALESLLPQSSIQIDRNTGVLSIDSWDLKPDYLFTPLTEINYAQIEENKGYVLDDMGFEFSDYNNDGLMDVKFFSSNPLGYQLLYTAVQNK